MHLLNLSFWAWLIRDGGLMPYLRGSVREWNDTHKKNR